MIKKLLLKKIVAAVGVAAMLLSSTGIQTLPVQASAVVKETQRPKLTYQARVSNFGWKGVVSENQIAGTTNEARTLTQFICSLQDADGNNAIRFRSHIRNVGWEQTWKQSWQTSGSADVDKCIEAVRIQLVGPLAKKYNIYYRLYAQGSWMGWACNGQKAGTEGLALPAEAIQIKLVEKGASVAQEGRAYIDGRQKPTLTYQAKVNQLGWKEVVSENQIAGTTGQAIPLTLINCYLKDFNGSNGILFRSHIRNMGWESEWKQSGQTSGWNAPDRCIEAVQMKLAGFLAQKYDIYYRLHVQEFGWMGWACNGEKAGTEGLALPAEAIQIKLVSKGTVVSREGTAYIDGTKNTSSTNNATSNPTTSLAKHAAASLAYAKQHWNDGKGLCAEFVSDCLKAGGISAWSRSCTALRTQLKSLRKGTLYKIPLEADRSIKASKYVGKLAAGDVVFYYCPGCTDGRPYIHAVLSNGMDANGYMKAYSHNSANSGTSKYRYSSRCYSCGTKISHAYVYHFH